MYHLLRQHPALFLPHDPDPDHYWLCKEPLHYCDDLGIAPWLRVSGDEEYGRLFDQAPPGALRGEASAWYLFSTAAIRRIREECGPQTKIIIGLRPPVAWMRSWHHDLLRYGYENRGDFADALAAEADRDAGRRLPRRAAFSGCLCYRRAARFSVQVRRYFETFGRENVKVVLMEDLNRDAAGTFASLCEFLGVDPSFVPEFSRWNDSSRLPKTYLMDLSIRRFTNRIPWFGQHKPKVVRRLWHIYQDFVDSRLPPLSDKSIDPQLEASLLDEFRGEVRELGELIGRDLSHWNEAPRRRS
jgi:hypothetical protein